MQSDIGPARIAASAGETTSGLGLVLRHLLRQPRVVIGGGILLLVALAALLAPWVAPHDPLEQDLLHMLAPPMWTPW